MPRLDRPLSFAADRRPEMVCRDLADKTLKELALKPLSDRAAGLRVLLLVLREHAGCSGTLIAELSELLEEIETELSHSQPLPLERKDNDDEQHRS